MLRFALLAVACLAVGVGSFYGTLIFLGMPVAGIVATPVQHAKGPATPSKGPAPKLAAGNVLYAADPKAVAFGSYAGAKFTKRDIGLEISSTFTGAAGNQSSDGMIYHNLPADAGHALSGQRIRIEVEATAARPGEQKLQIRFVQNGLKAGDWVTLPTQPGQNTYRANYDAPLDTRPAPKTDQIWLRSDADGAGLPLLIHAIRIVAN